ncbi:hypothetical protein LCGC14_2740370 [marine sediment metagenome]|uniref:Uncharacterized protein n=1 Tax=marine sediment metagenome TaxID=412755 RepID=A0A0F8ZRR3_9ZZZZ
MKNKIEQRKDIIIILLLMGILISVSYIIFEKPKTVYEEKLIEENLALLNVEYLGLYENLYDSTEMFFNYRLDNYGNAEAKNVKVICKIWDKNNNVGTSIVDGVGNVASNSYYLGEVVMEAIPYSSYEDGYITCYVKSCDDCKILYKEIEDLKETYEN